MSKFEDDARAADGGNLAAELWHFLGQSRKRWLLPIIVTLFVFGVLVFLSSTAAAPFIYSLF